MFVGELLQGRPDDSWPTLRLNAAAVLDSVCPTGFPGGPHTPSPKAPCL